MICREKNSLDKEKAKAKIEKSLKRNYYYGNREYPYKNVKPRIIAEKFMSDDMNDELIDYKFYCFHGKPQFLYVSQGMANHSMARLSYVSLAWEKMKFSRKDYKEFEVLPEKPSNFEKMIELAGILSEDIPFVRVDFYEIQWKMYFGEMTFYPCAGFAPFIPEEYDIELGKLLKLPEKNKG